jgi:hypothetical protein
MTFARQGMPIARHRRPSQPSLEQGHENPWTKKNPFMSMWLSGANAVIGSARSRATAETKRQANALITQGTKQMIDLWTNALTPPAKPKRKRSR